MKFRYTIISKVTINGFDVILNSNGISGSSISGSSISGSSISGSSTRLMDEQSVNVDDNSMHMLGEIFCNAIDDDGNNDDDDDDDVVDACVVLIGDDVGNIVNPNRLCKSLISFSSNLNTSKLSIYSDDDDDDDDDGILL